MDTRLQQIYVEETIHIIGFNYVKNINMERKIFHTMKDLAIRQFHSNDEMGLTVGCSKDGKTKHKHRKCEC